MNDIVKFLINRAENREKRGDVKGALDDLRTALGATNKSEIQIKLLKDISDILLQEGEPREALQYLKRLEKLRPNEAYPFYMLGTAHSLIMELKEALRY